MPAHEDRATTALPAGVTAELVQLRSDVAARHAQIELRNGGDEMLVVGEVGLDDPRFDGTATRVLDRESRIAPGATVDIPVQLPPMACPASGDAGSTLTVHYSLGEAAGIATLPIDERFPIVAPIHERECLAARVAGAAAVELAGFTPSPAGEPADLTLEIVPRGQGIAAEVVAVRETNLLSFGDPTAIATSYPVDVVVSGADEPPTTLHLPLVPGRCDPHAVLEDKRGTVFTVDVEVEGAAGEIQLAADDDMRGRILTWIAQWCGYAG